MTAQKPGFGLGVGAEPTHGALAVQFAERLFVQMPIRRQGRDQSIAPVVISLDMMRAGIAG